MSSYTKLTKHPKTGKWLMAEWLDDYFGQHRYGIRFPNGEIFDERKVKLETKET